jgi:hypothetical protein
MSPRAVLASVRDARLSTRAIAVAACVAVAAIVVAELGLDEQLGTAALLVAAIVVGELFVLRWPPRGELPLSYAVFPVVARGLDLRYAVATVVIAELISIVGDDRATWQPWRAVRGLAVGLAIVSVDHVVFAVFGHEESVVAVVGALLIAIAVGAAVDANLRRAEGSVQQTYWPERALYAWCAVIASAVMMAVAIRGIDGSGSLGVRGAALLGLPLLAVWWSYQSTDATTRMLQQTVDSLAMVPVLAGVVELGADARNAELARRVGARVGLTPDEQRALGVAAQLQHLGAATFDHAIDLTDERASGARDRTARATAKILRATPAYAAAGDIVHRAGTRRSRTAPQHGERDDFAAVVLESVTRYHAARAAGRDAEQAIERLRTPDADGRVHVTIDALEYVVLGGAGSAR